MKRAISWQSRDSISTVLCHFVRFRSPNEQGGATVEIESRDCHETRGSTVLFKKMWFWFDQTFPAIWTKTFDEIEWLVTEIAGVIEGQHSRQEVSSGGMAHKMDTAKI